MLDAADAPVHTQLQQWVTDRLRDAILHGEIKAGTWLRQRQLADQLGVSVMPVREALKRLVAEGLVEHAPYRGVHVVEFKPEDVEDLYACRAVIEGMAARHAAALMTDAELAEIASLHEAMAATAFPGELARYRELNRRFHEVIFGASRRTYLVRTLSQLWSVFPTMLWANIPRVALSSLPERDKPDTAEHAEIVAAFRAHDSDRAERAVRAHIEAAGNALVAAMRGLL